ncbi:hypothetical protein KP509_05G053300 [Ceratopteris richardii]|uniref:CRM domain-containing protein n=1 Tax=Ceratopteris richardii TaxID=49495 RepID=A0A8T2UQK6_CERRI|nr:hypothetical protein KP509_05G053300 [Ceratopteris richardii]
MALAPARLVRAVDPPCPSALSSASVCSSAGVYSQFSYFFFDAPGRRGYASVSASASEAQQLRASGQGHHIQRFRRQADENVPFDDLQVLYGHERGGLSHQPGRDVTERGRSFRGDGNGTRKVWERRKYSSPWKRNGLPQSETRKSFDKPISTQDRRSASSWDSFMQENVAEAYNRSSRQTTDVGTSRNLQGGTTDLESKVHFRQGEQFSDQGQGKASFQQIDYSHRTSASKFDALKQDNNLSHRHHLQESNLYQGRRDSLDRHLQRNSHADAEGNEYGSGGPDDLFHSGTERFKDLIGIREELKRHSNRADLEYLSNSLYGDMNLHATIQKDGSKEMLPAGELWKEETPNAGSEARTELERDQILESSLPMEMSPISRIMQKLRNVDNRIPPLHARERMSFRTDLADDLALPSAREYLSDRRRVQPIREQSEKVPGANRFPWEIENKAKEENSNNPRTRRLKPLSTAELTIPGPELRRLRILALHLKQRVKIGKQGVTKDLVNSIHQRFQTCEVVKVKCEGPPAGNMKQTLETLEERTGGLIIWKAGSAAVIYRGPNYAQPVSEIVDDLLAKKYQSLISSGGPQKNSSNFIRKDAFTEDVFSDKNEAENADGIANVTEQLDSHAIIAQDVHKYLGTGISPDSNNRQRTSQRKRNSGSEFDTLEEYNKEMDEILKELGPRYEEWTGPSPAPVDADLLPSTIPNYTPPYRVLPFGMRPSISNTLATHLRRLSQPLAPHFVIGRDRGLQGLAAAMIKLWEKSEIAKIQVKRGILNTNHERIAEDLKQLTGGFFLCRDKYSMTFFRGKDFLPPEISAILEERQNSAHQLQVEEKGRDERSINFKRSTGNSKPVPSWVTLMDPDEQIRLKRDAANRRRVQIIAHLQRKLKIALYKREKAEKEVHKVEEELNPVAPSDDKENLSEEERFMLRKLGLKMKAFLLVGRRGVFSGVVQNMHLHWKHRELVKIIIKERDPVQLNQTARMLEAESGGTLISVDPTSKGFAIVVYRGKNYTRPPQLRPANLLTKRLALRRSLETQRYRSLTNYIQSLEEEIVHIRAGLNKMKMLEQSDDSTFSDSCDETYNQPMSGQSKSIMLLESQETIEGEETSSNESFVEAKDGVPLSKISKRKLKLISEMGPIFRAERLSKMERHAFRKEVFKLSKAAQFHVGRSNPLSAVAKSIRLYFLDHAFVKIGVAYRPRGTSVQDVVEELEDLTGGTAYAQDDFRVVLYRGWPTGEDMPLSQLHDVLTPEQCDVLEEDDEDGVESHLLSHEPNQSFWEVNDEDEAAYKQVALSRNEEFSSDDNGAYNGEGIADLRQGAFCEEDIDDSWLEGFSDEDEVNDEDEAAYKQVALPRSEEFSSDDNGAHNGEGIADLRQGAFCEEDIDDSWLEGFSDEDDEDVDPEDDMGSFISEQVLLRKSEQSSLESFHGSLWSDVSDDEPSEDIDDDDYGNSKSGMEVTGDVMHHL